MTCCQEKCQELSLKCFNNNLAATVLQRGCSNCEDLGNKINIDCQQTDKIPITLT